MATYTYVHKFLVAFQLVNYKEVDIHMYLHKTYNIPSQLIKLNLWYIFCMWHLKYSDILSFIITNRHNCKNKQHSAIHDIICNS